MNLASDIDMDTAPGLMQNTIYHYNNNIYIGYTTTSGVNTYGAQLRFGHWLTKPEYRYNQGNKWSEWTPL